MFQASVILLALPIISLGQDLPTICLQNGACYQGSWKDSLSSRYASFKGIRFAQPPIGKLRFKSPEPYIAQEGLHDVSQESNITCPNYSAKEDNSAVKGQEDCLVLNIFVPKIVFDEPHISELPVMFWIHGGGLTGGSGSSYNPRYLMDEEIVLITTNYRLGTLGFLSLGTMEVPGNAGFRDQTIAMTWVKENIQYFGGNSNSMTIFGESAGALSVAMHLMSPKSEGLFQRAIMQSGTALAPTWGMNTPERAVSLGNLLAKGLECDQEEDILVCMQAKPMEDIIALSNLMHAYPLDNLTPNWNGVPDVNFTNDPFFPGDAETLLASGQFNTDVEVIIGSNLDEGILGIFPILQGMPWPDFAQINWPARLFNIANTSNISPQDIENANKILEFYVGSVENINEEHMQEVIDMFTDADFLYGTFKTINYLLKQEVKVYQFLLTFEGSHSSVEGFGIDPMGVCHGDDLIYLWDIFGNLSGNDKIVSDLMIEAWIDFAKYGDPTPASWSWTPAWDRVAHYWNISGSYPGMATNQYIQSRMELWSQIVG